jgi:hypothetical protein
LAAKPTLNQSQQGAYDLLASTLKSWGLGTLLPDLKGFILGGDTSPDTLSLKLSQTTAYKQRFAGNEERRKNGLPELNPAQYIGLEEQYSNVLRSYGLPAGFYDSHKDFTDFIGKDISPSEIQTRAQIAHDQYQAAPAYMRELWGQYFGGKGDAIAAILDPDTATSVIQDRAKQVGIGAAGAQYGFGVSANRAQQFAQRRHPPRGAAGVPPDRRCSRPGPGHRSALRPAVQPADRRERPSPRRPGRGAEAAQSLRLRGSAIPGPLRSRRKHSRGVASRPVIGGD